MARISKERKEAVRKSIIDHSKELFFAQGYDATSTSQIAKAVGISEGTIFNYFKTKGDIFLEVMVDDIEAYQKSEALKVSINESIVDQIMEYIERYISKACFLPKKLLLELGITVLNMAKSRPSLIKRYAELDFKFIEQIAIMIEGYKKIGALGPCDSKVLSEVIYGGIAYEIIIFLYQEDMSKQEVIENIRKKIDAIIKPYSIL